MVEKKGQKMVRIPVAARLKAARENAGYLSAKDFCEKHGLLLEKYEQHENAGRAIPASSIMSYCSLLNISIYYLMLGEEYEDLVLRKTRD